MKWLLALGGLFLFGVLSGFESGLKAMLFGFLIGAVIDHFRTRGGANTELAALGRRFEERLAASEQSVAELRARLIRLERAGSAPAAAAAAEETAPAASDAAPALAGSAPPDLESPPAVVESPGAEPPFATDRPPAAPVTPAQPSALELAWRWLWGGNTVVKVGIVILFFGVGFLVKYAADQGMLSVELRLAGVALTGIALLVFGYRLTSRSRAASHEEGADGHAEALRLQRIKAGYGLSLQGAAVGMLYLTTFGAFRLYALLPSGPAFALMVAIVVLSAVLAVRQDSVALAAFGAAGGFLAPILASTGGGSHVALFSFYVLLNAGILGIAWFRSWRVLNLLGFVFTFAIAALWGASAYRPEHLASTEPFLVVFLIFYVAIAVLHALRQAPRLASVVDGTLVFGTPIVAFSLQAALVRDIPFGAAYSALAVSAMYLGLAVWLRRRAAATMELLVECFLALGVVFATLAVPLALDGRWTAGAWALEGAAVVWVGLRQQRRLARIFGYVVMVGAAVAFASDAADWRGATDWPVFNAACIGGVLVALSALFVARALDRAAAPLALGERRIASIAALWGGLWWLGVGVAELEHWLPRSQAPNAIALFLALSVGLADQAARRGEWPRLSRAIPLLLPLLGVAALNALAQNGHPFAAYGWFAWPFAFATHFLLLARFEREAGAPAFGSADYAAGLHCLGVWLITLLAIIELRHFAASQALARSVWAAAAAALPLILAMFWITSRPASMRWPVHAHARTYLVGALTPIVVLAWFWIFHANWRYDGFAGPLPYLPLLNALDLTHAFVILAIVAWWRAMRRAAIRPSLETRRLFAAALGAAGFFWINAVLLRTIHHWGGVPYRFDALMRSMLVQAALSIFWTLLALGLMLYAHRRAIRAPWVAGAVLMAAVVGKLFLVDLSNVGGIERIVSFIVVGLLMLAIGYFSPLPPRVAAEKAAA